MIPSPPTYSSTPDSMGTARGEGGIPDFVEWVGSRYSQAGYQASLAIAEDPSAVVLLWGDASPEVMRVVSSEGMKRGLSVSIVPWPYNQQQYDGLVRQLQEKAGGLAPAGVSPSAIFIQPTDHGKSVILRVEFRGENLSADELQVLGDQLQQGVDPRVKVVAGNATSVPG